MSADPASRAAIEVELKEMGCPYGATDPRVLVWFEGYRAGFKARGDLTKQVYAEVAKGRQEKER